MVYVSLTNNCWPRRAINNPEQPLHPDFQHTTYDVSRQADCTYTSRNTCCLFAVLSSMTVLFAIAIVRQRPVGRIFIPLLYNVALSASGRYECLTETSASLLIIICAESFKNFRCESGHACAGEVRQPIRRSSLTLAAARCSPCHCRALTRPILSCRRTQNDSEASSPCSVRGNSHAPPLPPHIAVLSADDDPKRKFSLAAMCVLSKSNSCASDPEDDEEWAAAGNGGSAAKLRVRGSPRFPHRVVPLGSEVRRNLGERDRTPGRCRTKRTAVSRGVAYAPLSRRSGCVRREGLACE